MPIWWNPVLIAFAATAATADLWRRRIPRWLTVTGLLAGLLFHCRYGSIVDALGAAFLAFVVGLIFFSIGAIGGGDVKLITALGAMLGLHPWLRAMEIAIFTAAAMALIQIIRHRAVRKTLHNVGEIFKNFGRIGITAHPEINVKNPAMLRSPFGLAAAIGVVAAVMKL